jgi:hypothetical protein
MPTVERRLARVEAQLLPLREEPPDLRHVITSEEAAAEVAGWTSLPIFINSFMTLVPDQTSSPAERLAHAVLNHEAGSAEWIAARDRLDRLARGETEGISRWLAADEVTRARRLWCLLARYYVDPVFHLPLDPVANDGGTGQTRTKQDTPTSH